MMLNLPSVCPIRYLVRGIDCGDSILLVSDLVALADRVAALNS
jgi:hypothetical protein